MVSGGASLHADQAGRNLRQCVEECSAPHLLAPDDKAFGIDRVKLENGLGQIMSPKNATNPRPHLSQEGAQAPWQGREDCH
jgi:hypothetical protein